MTDEDTIEVKPEEATSAENDVNDMNVNINVEGASIVQIPQSLLPLLLPKKDPIRIGIYI